MTLLDLCSDIPDLKRANAIIALHNERQTWVSQAKKGFRRYQKALAGLSLYQTRHVDASGDAVVIGAADEVSEAERQEIEFHLRQFMPWRKGPFSIFGVDIDAEWQSQRKWNRLAPMLPDLRGKIIADIGCNNGYYLFKMSESQPKLALGFEPVVQHYYSFKALNAMAGRDNLDIAFFGVEHLSLFPTCFDIIFMMGILYHRSSPVDCLRDAMTALRPGGILIVESQIIPGDQPVALFPEATYAKAPGTWFVPTASCLENWLLRAGFEDIIQFCRHPMSSTEQRRTNWMTFESYEDFLDPADPNLTHEGYPAPWRLYVRAHKKA
ncbi:MAG: tRNA 5-methoxyuridine(34)/uridine 5-oxyacetic acid(34) synthase CmoB [Desulfobulbaceae bacterium]|jgi:tRNA (mo5U34)-methyltransferase|nr:tRNA 5-methoxyuridine(34)/uridine 5-oxyacetic acid(34) synthase CmoB [Desulfobulbaceae bacterium]